MKNYKYILTHSSGNLTVEYNPVNWNNFNMVFARSERYHSVLRSQIVDSEFPRDGKAYIDDIYETYGIDTDIGCEIQYLDKSDFTYATLFEGVIDLSDWVSRRDTTTVKIIDSSIMALFSSRDEIEVPINRANDLDGGSMSSYTYLNTMSVEGVQIEMRAYFNSPSTAISIVGAQTSTVTLWNGITALGWDINDIGADATLPAVSLGSASGPIYTNNTGGNQKIRYRVKTRIVGSVDVTHTSGTWSYTIKAFTGIGGATTAINLGSSGSANELANYDTSYDSGYTTVTLTAGQTIDLYHEFSCVIVGASSIYNDFEYQPIYVEVFEVTDAKAATDIDMPLLHELGAKLLELITGQSDPLNAPLLGRTDSEPRTYVSDGDYSLSGVASGNMLREFDFDDKPLITSFADFFKTLDALYNLGMYWDADNSEFVIGDKEDFYKDSKIITLGEVEELEISIATEQYFNSIKTGYQEKLDYEDVNGSQNFNVPGEFANDGKRIQNILDLQSVYHADDYGIELARKNADDLTSAEDSRFDGQKFIITGQRDGGDYITIQGYDDFTVITGIYTPGTRLNLNITPKRNMLRSANLLSIPLFITEGDTNFMTNQYELSLETKKAAESQIAEKDDLAYTDLEEPLYYPELYNFTAPLTNDDILQLLDDPHGYVEFDYLGETYQGFILEVSTEPFNRKGNWTLIKVNPDR